MTIEKLYLQLRESMKKGDKKFIYYATAALRDGFLEGIFSSLHFDPAPPGKYTRKKIMGTTEDDLVIRAMEWNSVCVPPHEHHGRPCFEIILGGVFRVTMWSASKKREGYALRAGAIHSLHPGDVAVLTHDENIHSVECGGVGRSLHIYPLDKPFTYVYKKSGSLWERIKVPLATH